MQYSLLPYSVFCPHCAWFPLILSLWWCCRQFEITEEPRGRSAGEFVQEFCVWGSLRCILFSPPGACRVIPSEVCVKGPLLLCSAVSCAASITADSRPCQDCVTRRDASCHTQDLGSFVFSAGGGAALAKERFVLDSSRSVPAHTCAERGRSTCSLRSVC